MATQVITSDGNLIFTSASVAATGTNSSDVCPVAEYKAVSVQAVWAGVSSGTAAFKVQASCDGTNWDDVPGANSVTVGTSGSVTLNMGAGTAAPSAYMRATITSAAGAGTIVYTFVGKK